MRSFLFATAMLTLLSAGTAAAQTMVVGEGYARSCYLSAKSDNPGTRSAISTCGQALSDPQTTRRDLAATHSNLGILLVRAGDVERALDHHNEAIRIKPDLGQAYLNRGSVLLIDDRDLAGAEQDYDTAIELGVPDLHVAYYARALARERRQNLTGAFNDLQTALEIQPGWGLAQEELARYTVREEPRS